MTGGPARQRLWLVDHLLRDGVGHHLGYNASIARAATDAGFEPLIVGHRSLDPSSVGNCRVETIFRSDWRNAPPQWVSSRQFFLQKLESIAATRFRKDLARLPDIRSEDLVFAQMIAPRHFSAWLEWLGSRRPAPHLVLHLGYQPQRFGTPQIKNALDALPSHAAEALVLVTDSEKLAPAFREVLGKEVHYLPHIVGHCFPDARPHEAGAPVTFLAPGNARKEKGFGELLEVMAAVRDLRDSGRARFRVQCHQPDLHCEALLRKRAPLAGVEWIDHAMEDEQYVRAFREADVVLVPYHLDYYRMRTSGVFCEARVAGKTVLATEESWAGDRVARDGGGWLCKEKNVASLESALRRAVEEIAPVAARARTLQSPSREEFGPHSFVAGLVKLASLPR